MAGNEEAQQTGHQEVDYKSLLQNDPIYQMVETSVCPREPESMKELRELAAQHPWNTMITSAEEGQFRNMLLKLMNAQNTMEIGVYTGYSLLATALALPEDGKILAMDTNRKNYEWGLAIIQKAGVAHKIDFREGPAMAMLDQLIQEFSHGSFDFVYVDADKENYLEYHQRLIELVKVGGLICYNTLREGTVGEPLDTPMKEYMKRYGDMVGKLNKALSVDPRIEICMLLVGGDVTLCRRIK